MTDGENQGFFVVALRYYMEYIIGNAAKKRCAPDTRLSMGTLGMKIANVRNRRGNICLEISCCSQENGFISGFKYGVAFMMECMECPGRE